MSRIGTLLAALFLTAPWWWGATPVSAQTPAQVYAHPDGLFEVAIPASARLQPGEGSLALRVMSRHGWIATIQAAPANRDMDFRDMINKLESRYLGDGKAWSQKLGEQVTEVGGLPALEAVYEGSRSRWQAVIARGSQTDFVFLLSAPPNVQAERADEMRGLLLSFRPRPGEIPEVVSPSPMTSADKPPATGQRPSAPPERADPAADSDRMLRRFSEPAFGFSVAYPADWDVSREGPFTATFSGREGSEAYYTTVSFQNVSPEDATDPVAAAETAFDDWRDRIAGGATDLTYIGEQEYPYDRGGVRLVGQEFLVTYGWDGQRFSKWVIVLPNPAQPVAHVFAYTAPESLFQTYRPVAEAILRSWTIHGTQGANDNR